MDETFILYKARMKKMENFMNFLSNEENLYVGMINEA